MRWPWPVSPFREFLLLVKFRRCGWDGATEVTQQASGICTAPRLPATASVRNQYLRDSSSWVSHRRHILTHEHIYTHIWTCTHTQMQARIRALRHTNRNTLTDVYMCAHTCKYTWMPTLNPQFLLLPPKMFTVMNSRRKEITHWFITGDIIRPGEFCKMAISLWKAEPRVCWDHRQPWSIQQFRCGQLVLTSTYLAESYTQDFWFGVQTDIS